MTTKRRKVPASYKKGFQDRLKAARTLAGLTQEEVARALNLGDRDKWTKYENRDLLPHDLIIPVCDLLNIDADALLRDPRKTTKEQPFLQPKPTGTNAG